MRRIGIVLVATSAAAVVGEISLRLTPFPAALQEAPKESVVFVDRYGTSLRQLLVDERRHTRHCPLEEISPSLLTATLAAEDRRFYTHPGVDVLAVGRAVWRRISGHGPASGASTLTMQLVKTAEGAQERTWRRKVSEAWKALRVERSWSKQQILAEYLNRVEYGNLQVGVASASHFYFDKPPSDLSLGEAALLASLPKAPTRLDPSRHPAEAESRRRWVLSRLRVNREADEEALESARRHKPQLAAARIEPSAQHYVDLLLHRRDLLPAKGGLVQTTLDLPLNRFVLTTLQESLREVRDKHATAAAGVVLDNTTGEVLALACASGPDAGNTADVNTAWMERSPGSAIKPFSFLLALQRGCEPCTVVPDVATDFPTPTGSYRPNNYNFRFHGPVSLRFALGNSLNVAAIRALELGGGPAELQHAMRLCGVTTLHHEADYYGLGLTLGNGEVRLLELAGAYATLARLGEQKGWRLLKRESPTDNGKVRLFDPTAAYLLADMLSDNEARASSFGLESFLAFPYPVACKTGTSSDYRDNWCMAYTPEYTVGVWVGNADGSPMQGVTGVTGAAPAMHEIMDHLHTTRGTTWYSQPRELKRYPVDPLTGRTPPPEAKGNVLEICLHPPGPTRPADYRKDGTLVLPPIYHDWLVSAQNTLGNLVVGNETATNDERSIAILEPAPGSVYYLDPDLPASSQSIPLRAASLLPVEWHSGTLELFRSNRGTHARLAEGRHQFEIRDPITGKTLSTWIEVKAL